MMKVPVLGLVENMSEFKCPGCGQVHRIFGEGKAREIAAAHSIAATASIPIDPAYSRAVDAGEIENVDTSVLDPVLDAIV
jgi:Mrp family chromosome partitioning ATPase